MDKRIEEILKQYPYIGEDIQKAQKEINRYLELQQEARNPLKSQSLTDMPHGYEISDQTYNAICKLLDLYQAEIDKYVSRVNELMDLKKWLDKAFSLLTENERRIVYLKYDAGLSSRKIGDIMHVNKNVILCILEDTLSKIKRIMI